MKPVSDEQLTSEDFLFEVVKSFIAIRPFFDYMSEILTRHLRDYQKNNNVLNNLGNKNPQSSYNIVNRN